MVLTSPSLADSDQRVGEFGVCGGVGQLNPLGNGHIVTGLKLAHDRIYSESAETCRYIGYDDNSLPSKLVEYVGEGIAETGGRPHNPDQGVVGPLIVQRRVEAERWQER